MYYIRVSKIDKNRKLIQWQKELKQGGEPKERQTN